MWKDSFGTEARKSRVVEGHLPFWGCSEGSSMVWWQLGGNLQQRNLFQFLPLSLMQHLPTQQSRQKADAKGFWFSPWFSRFMVAEGTDQGNYLVQGRDCFWDNQVFQMQRPTSIDTFSLRRKIRWNIGGHGTHLDTYEFLRHWLIHLGHLRAQAILGLSVSYQEWAS